MNLDDLPAPKEGFVTLVTAGGPPDDKPGVSLTTPADPARTSGFINVREIGRAHV